MRVNLSGYHSDRWLFQTQGNKKDPSTAKDGNSHPNPRHTQVASDTKYKVKILALTPLISQ